MVRRVMMIAGETSGEHHGAGVVRVLRAMQPGIEVYGIGGEQMRAAGMELIHHCAELSFMGFAEVLRNLPTVFRVERDLEVLLSSRRPDVVVLIDYPGFNLRFARSVKRAGIPVLYYISPQVWAWNRGRIRRMKSLVDRMKVVFPFEVEMYRGAGIDVEFVGHPIVEHIGGTMTREQFFSGYGLDPGRKVLGLLPGSRLQEIKNILPVVSSAALALQQSGGCQVVLGLAPHLTREVVSAAMPEGLTVTVVERATYDVMKYSDAIVVTSGTATLETGWFGTPMVVVYRTSPLSFFIGRMLVDVPYIGLVNIVAGRKVAEELLQGAMTVGNIVRAVRPLLEDPVRAAVVRKDLEVIRSRLGGPGASDRVATAILSLGAAA
jgi:lipid-A-disaccharide synthase